MKAGDPKQTAVLSVVAVVVLGVAVMRILPKKDSSLEAVAKAQQEAAAAQASGALESATVLRADPFFHPDLGAERKAAAAAGGSGEAAAPLPAITTEIPTKWNPADGSTPVRPTGPGGEQVPAESTGSTGSGKPVETHGQPEETTGSNQQEENSHQVVVNAILTVAKPLAYIAIDGEEFRLGVGADLRGLGTIASISSRAVVVKTPKGKVTLIIGEPKKL